MSADEDMEDATDRVMRETFFSDDIEAARTGLDMLTHADELCHARIVATGMVGGDDSPSMALELVTHIAVAHMHLRAKSHVEKLEANVKPRTRAEEVSQMATSIKMLYIAEAPEFLEKHGVFEPLEDGHVELLASWLLGEGWTR